MDAVEKKMDKEVSVYIREREDEARSKAADSARNIIALAIQRYAQEETIERTVSVVGLPSEEMKGRIIGREGRNIKAIEQATPMDSPLKKHLNSEKYQVTDDEVLKRLYGLK